jgi:hypothetical protein
MSRAEMTRSKAPRTVNTSVSRRPLSVLPKAAYRGSCWECDEPGATTNGRLKNTPSASPRVTSCKFQFLSAFPASHSNPTQRVSSSGKRCTTCILLPYTLPASCFPGAANYTKARAMLSSTHFHSSSRRYWRRAFAGFRLDAALLLLAVGFPEPRWAPCAGRLGTAALPPPKDFFLISRPPSGGAAPESPGDLRPRTFPVSAGCLLNGTLDIAWLRTFGVWVPLPTGR